MFILWNNGQILCNHIRVYVDFLFQLNLLLNWNQFHVGSPSKTWWGQCVFKRFKLKKDPKFGDQISKIITFLKPKEEKKSERLALGSASVIKIAACLKNILFRKWKYFCFNGFLIFRIQRLLNKFIVLGLIQPWWLSGLSGQIQVENTVP